MKSIFSKSYPQPSGETRPPNKPYLSAQDDDRRSALLLTSVAAASLFLATGVTYLKSDSAVSTQKAAVISTTRSAPAVVAAEQKKDAPETALQSMASFSQNALPQVDALDELPKDAVPKHERAPILVEAEPSPVPETQQTDVVKAEVKQPTHAFALIDEATGTAKQLDTHAVASLLKPAAPPQQQAAADAVTRLETSALDAVPQTPEPVARNCVEDLRVIAQNSTIYFLSGGAQLSPRGIAKARAVGAALTACPEAVIQVSGHSDSTGDEQTNIAMSWQRADNTIAILEGMGFDTSRMDPVGFGARLPLEEGDTSAEMDRRVEFRVMEKR